MATTIGKLVVLLSGNVNGFVSSFGKARKAMSSFAAQSASVASGMVISRVVEAGAAALVNFAKEISDDTEVSNIQMMNGNKMNRIAPLIL